MNLYRDIIYNKKSIKMIKKYNKIIELSNFDSWRENIIQISS